MCECESPRCFEESVPVARKIHICGECGKEIKIGQRYWKIRGIWDEHFETHKMCKSCRKLADEIDHCICFGEVLYTAKELGIDAV